MTLQLFQRCLTCQTYQHTLAEQNPTSRFDFLIDKLFLRRPNSKGNRSKAHEGCLLSKTRSGTLHRLYRLFSSHSEIREVADQDGEKEGMHPESAVG